jgi:hypothetical protein
MLVFCLLLLGQDTAETLLRDALALAREKRLEEAESKLTQGMRLYPRVASFPVELAGIDWLQQRPVQARRRLLLALRLDPGNRYASDFLGTLFLLDDNLPAALKYWNRVEKPLVQNLYFEPSLPLRPLLRDRAFIISPGQVFTLDRWEATRDNLARLHVASDSRFELTARDDQRFDLTFRSVPESLQIAGWLGVVLPYARGLPYQTLFVEQRNIGKSGTTVESMWRWDPNKRRALVEFSSPWRMDPGKMLKVTLEVRDERWVRGFRLRRYEASTGMEFALGPRTTWSTGVQLARRDWFVPGWTYSFPNRLSHRFAGWPEHRITVRWDGEARPGRLTGTSASRFLVATNGIRTEWRPHNYEVAWRLGAGAILGSIPLDEWFNLGLDRDSPLWLRGHAGLRDGQKGAGPLSTRYVMSQMDALRTLWKHPGLTLSAGPFLDGANLRGSGWLCDAGVLLRVRTLGGVSVTLIYGRDLRGGKGTFFADSTR